MLGCLSLTGLTSRRHAFICAWNFLPTLIVFFTCLILEFSGDSIQMVSTSRKSLLTFSTEWDARSPYVSYSLYLMQPEMNHIIFALFHSLPISSSLPNVKGRREPSSQAYITSGWHTVLTKVCQIYENQMKAYMAPKPFLLLYLLMSLLVRPS